MLTDALFWTVTVLVCLAALGVLADLARCYRSMRPGQRVASFGLLQCLAGFWLVTLLFFRGVFQQASLIWAAGLLLMSCLAFLYGYLAEKEEVGLTALASKNTPVDGGADQTLPHLY